ncbi:MAG: PilZ domain-containing protein [Candidatus Scalindua sp.]
MPLDYNEKRDFVRMHVDCPLTFKASDSNQEETGHAVNLSGRGVLFIAEREIPIDTALEITIQPAPIIPTPPLHAKSRVIRVTHRTDDKGFEIAATIEKMLE